MRICPILTIKAAVKDKSTWTSVNNAIKVEYPKSLYNDNGPIFEMEDGKCIKVPDDSIIFIYRDNKDIQTLDQLRSKVFNHLSWLQPPEMLESQIVLGPKEYSPLAYGYYQYFRQKNKRDYIKQYFVDLIAYTELNRIILESHRVYPHVYIIDIDQVAMG